MNAIQVLGDAETVLAFALGGVPGRVVQTVDEARAVVDGVVNDIHRNAPAQHQPVLLLVTQGTADLIRSDLNRVILDSRGPLILEIPGFGEPLGQSSVARFVRRVLGVHL
jgi:vacuolar-type H+-ATPase subunit F/Vma7